MINLQLQCHGCKSIFIFELRRLHNGQETSEVCGKQVVNYEKTPISCKLNKGHEGGCNPYVTTGVSSVAIHTQKS